MQEITIGKTYRHYKGNVYKIIALGRHSETLEDMVVYQSVETGEVWVRPKAMWNDVIPQSLSHKGLRENSAEADQESQDNTGVLQLSADNLSTCVAVTSETAGAEVHSEVDLALQDKPVDDKLSTDNRSTCVALRFTLL